MKLTDKCLEDFLKWLSINHEIGIEGFEFGKSVVQNALIIEFFDSVQIFISINYICLDEFSEGFESMVTYKHLTSKNRVISDRKTAIDSGISAANEIYNSKEK